MGSVVTYTRFYSWPGCFLTGLRHVLYVLFCKAEDEQDCTREVVGRMTRDEAGDMLPTEPGAEQGHTDVSGDYLCKNSE